MRQGNANDPFHLPDCLEAVISLRMARTEQSPLLSLLQCRQGVTMQASVVVVVLGDLVTMEAFCKGLERSTQLFITR